MAETRDQDRRSAETTHFTFVMVPRFNMMALTATLEPLRIANYLTGRPLYYWRFLSVDGGQVPASNDMTLDTEKLESDAPRPARVFVCGSWGSEHYKNRELFAWLRRQDRLGVPLASMDIGVYILARAGLLKGSRVAVLWYCRAAFSEAYPDIQAEERLFLEDRNRLTIAGGTAGLDAMLAEISQRQSVRLAGEVADHILHYPWRNSDSAQRGNLGVQHSALPKLLQAATKLMDENIEEPLSQPEIARRMGVSQRKLERLFQKHCDSSPVGYYRLLRLQQARVLLTNTGLSIREIALACGYGSLSHFSKSFSASFGRRPRDYRDAWPQEQSAPVWQGLSMALSDKDEMA